MDSNADSNGCSVQQTQLIGQSLHCRARRIVAGVPVDVPGDRDGGVAEQVGHRLDVHLGIQPGHGGTVAQRVDADFGHARLLRRDLHSPQDIARVYRRSEVGMTTAAMGTYAYDQIDQARTGLEHPS
jgi:hypothetical protein